MVKRALAQAIGVINIFKNNLRILQMLSRKKTLHMSLFLYLENYLKMIKTQSE